MTNKRVAVAGSNGFLGTHIVEYLSSQQGVDIFALVRPCSAYDQFSNANVSVIEIDITDASSTLNRVQELCPSHLINATSYGVQPSEEDFVTSVAVNVSGTFNLLCAAEPSVKRFIQVGSYFEYGGHESVLTEETPLQPASTYAANKVAASMLLNDKRLCGSMETVLARVFHIWGPREKPHRLTPQIIKAVKNSDTLGMTPGTQEKDFTFVLDAARWIVGLALLESPLSNSVFNIAGGRRCSVRAFAESIAARMNGEALLNFGVLPVPKREPLSGIANTTRLEDNIGPLCPTPFDQAVSTTIESFTAP